MIHPARLPIGLAKNSKPSSQRNRLVSRSSEPLGVNHECYILPCRGPAERPPSRPAAIISTFPRALLFLDLSNSPNKTHSRPSSGLVQPIFSSPARLRSRFLFRLRVLSPRR